MVVVVAADEVGDRVSVSSCVVSVCVLTATFEVSVTKAVLRVSTFLGERNKQRNEL